MVALIIACLFLLWLLGLKTLEPLSRKNIVLIQRHGLGPAQPHDSAFNGQQHTTVNRKRNSECEQASGRWDENQYLHEDGILPWQRCGATDFTPGSKPLETTFMHDDRLHSIVLTAASVWGTSDAATGEPISMQRVEFLMFMKVAGKRCQRDSGNHCCYNPKGNLPHVECRILNDSWIKGYVMVTPRYRDLKHERKMDACTAVFTMECPYPYARLLSFNDVSTVQLRIGKDRSILGIDLCYQLVKKIFPLTICTEPLHKFNMTNAFWSGHPQKFPLSQNLMDYFMKHHIQSLGGVRIVIYDVMDSLRGIALKYKDYVEEGTVAYRSHVAAHMGTTFEVGIGDMHSSAYSWAFEPLMESTCMWEHRLNTKMTMILHSPDNYLIPNHYRNFSDFICSIKFSSVVVPTVQAFTPPGERRIAANILKQWNILGQDFEFGNGRHTPMANPRHIIYNYVHWNPAWYAGKFRGELSFQDAWNIMGIHTVHIMALARPGMDKHNGRRDAVYQNLSELLDMYDLT